MLTPNEGKNAQDEQRGKEYYAVARWTVEDIHNYRKDNELKKWTNDAVEEWLLSTESRIQDRMIERGWEAIYDLMDSR